MYVIGALVTRSYWTVAGSSFDAGRRSALFPLLTAAAIAGAFVGTLAAGPGAQGDRRPEPSCSSKRPLLGLAVRLLSRWSPDHGGSAPDVRAPIAGATSVVADVRAGFERRCGLALLRRIAIAYVLLAILMFSVTVPVPPVGAGDVPE